LRQKAEKKHTHTMGWSSILNSSSISPALETTNLLSSDIEKVQDQQQMQEIDQQREQSQRHEIKAKLKSLLMKYNGCTKHPDVVQLIEELSNLNPASQAADISKSPLFLGEFYALTSPNFPGRIKPSPGQEHIVQYTLGRLSFNLFEPKKLVCTLQTVRNPVYPMETSSQDDSSPSNRTVYPLYLDITIHTPKGDLDAVLRNEAFCCPAKDKPDRIMVTFTGGSLEPASHLSSSPDKLELWAETFKDAYTKAEEERSYVGTFFHYILKLMLGLTLPTDETLRKHTFHHHFEMKRSPVGSLDILYLDQDIRITKGNRGTLCVVERATSSCVDEGQ
jgi:hypothetical protein